MTSNDSLIDSVTTLIKDVADSVLTPRFGELTSEEVGEKSPGEIVTSVDRAAETHLTAGLHRIRNAPVVGEESTESVQSARDLISSSEECWIVDPLDGTRNYVDGNPDHAIMVAFSHLGRVVASWMWQPQHDVLAVAEHGSGAWLDGQRIASLNEPMALPDMHGVVRTGFLPGNVLDHVSTAAPAFSEFTPGAGCAGVDYPHVAAGAHHFLLYWRTLPWDHAPGTLFAEEAGCRAALPDGTPWRPEAPTEGLLVAPEALWGDVARVLLPSRR